MNFIELYCDYEGPQMSNKKPAFSIKELPEVPTDLREILEVLKDGESDYVDEADTDHLILIIRQCERILDLIDDNV